MTKSYRVELLDRTNDEIGEVLIDTPDLDEAVDTYNETRGGAEVTIRLIEYTDEPNSINVLIAEK